MPKDQRLYMTFPNDMHRHPKLVRLPVEVRWTFIEMNGEARIADNDGVFDADEAEFMWPKEHLDALLRSHPQRPLVVRENGVYVIREYAEHQQTRAERERLAEVSRENGRKGGRPRKNPEGTQPKPSQVSSGTQPQPRGTQTKAESESEDLTTYVSESSHVVDARVSTDSKLTPTLQKLASNQGITSVSAITDQIRKSTGITVTDESALGIAVHLLGKARSEPRAPQRYVIGAISRSPLEIQKHIHDRGLAA